MLAHLLTYGPFLTACLAWGVGHHLVGREG